MAKVPRVILLIESSRASGRSLLRGVANYARHHGPWVFTWEPAGLENAWPKLKTLAADGIILRDVEKVEEVLAQGIPAVVFGHSHKEIPGQVNVLTEDAAVGRMVAEHLMGCGFRHFAYCGFEDKPWSEQRSQFFRQHLAAAGFETQVYRSRSTAVAQSWEQEQVSLARWLKSLPKPVGLMACNDDRGRHTIEACKRAGLRMPEEIAIIGADNDELICELSAPALSSVAINFERAGYEGAQVLDQLMRGQRVHTLNIVAPATHIVARQSTDILAVQDEHLARALRFIREHGREPMRVMAVAQASGLSRRVLEKRFRRVLGRSILSEIRRVRVSHICRLLVETNQSVAQIGLQLGYGGIEHVARYFRAEKKMSPLAYRKKFGQR